MLAGLVAVGSADLIWPESAESDDASPPTNATILPIPPTSLAVDVDGPKRV